MASASATIRGDTIATNANTHHLSDKWTLWAHLPHDTEWSLKSYTKIYEFVHTDGRTEACSRAELIQKYSLSAGHVSSMITGKSKYPHKGWTLKKIIEHVESDK